MSDQEESEILQVFMELERLRFALQDSLKQVVRVKAFLAKVDHAHVLVECGCGWEDCIICVQGYCPKCNHYMGERIKEFGK